MTSEHTDKPEHPEHAFNIQIDRMHYKVHKQSLTGAELRHVPPTPIPPDRDLFLVVPSAPDRKIEDADAVSLRNGERFFTAPGQINPGRIASN